MSEVEVFAIWALTMIAWFRIIYILSVIDNRKR